LRFEIVQDVLVLEEVHAQRDHGAAEQAGQSREPRAAHLAVLDAVGRRRADPQAHSGRED
jgi:hypothetical protein